jgi:hypothetical protein
LLQAKGVANDRDLSWALAKARRAPRCRSGWQGGALVSAVWICVIVVGMATIAVKAGGPVLAAGLLAGGFAGLLAGGFAILLRAPVLVVVPVAAASAGGLRAIT